MTEIHQQVCATRYGASRSNSAGRTHQIRVHLSHLGYPIVGDDTYGGRHLTAGDLTGPAGTPEQSPRDPLITRQALHAALLGFTHPITGEPMEFQAPPAEDMRQLIELLRQTRDVERPKVAGVRIATTCE